MCDLILGESIGSVCRQGFCRDECRIVNINTRHYNLRRFYVLPLILCVSGTKNFISWDSIQPNNPNLRVDAVEKEEREMT
jgi:hypothetical protein